MLMRLRFRTALSPSKRDTNKLVSVMAECMGMKDGTRSKEYLEDFFDNCETS
jgi:hypothetical protein